MRSRSRDLCPRRFQQLPIFHAGGTRRLARATTETAIDMSFKRWRLNRQPLFLNCAHQVDAPARAVVLVSGGNVSGTSFQTKTAVHTSQKLFFFSGESVGEQC